MKERTLEEVLAERHTMNRETVIIETPMVQLVFFALGEDWFAFHGEKVREILVSAETFFIPGGPPSLEGVINVRGDIESVIRFDELLQRPVPDRTGAATLLLGRAGAMTSGIRVDRVLDVADVPQDNIQPPPSNLSEALRPFVSGVLRHRDRTVTLLDMEGLFQAYLQGMG